MHGIRIKGYKGIITTTAKNFDEPTLNSIQEEDNDDIEAIPTDINAQCIGSGKGIKLYPDIALHCNVGDNLKIDLYLPEGPDKWGVFTLTTIKNIDEKNEIPMEPPRLNTHSSSIILTSKCNCTDSYDG